MIRLVSVYGKNDRNVECLIFTMVCHLPLAEHPADLNALVNDMTRYINYYTDIRVEIFREDWHNVQSIRAHNQSKQA